MSWPDLHYKLCNQDHPTETRSQPSAMFLAPSPKWWWHYVSRGSFLRHLATNVQKQPIPALHPGLKIGKQSKAKQS